MIVLDFANWAIMPIYALTLWFAFTNIVYVTCSSHLKLFHIIINGAIFTQSAMYLGLQVEWILSDHGEEIGSLTELLWLLYEYLVGLIILTLTMTAPEFIKMENKK